MKELKPIFKVASSAVKNDINNLLSERLLVQSQQ